MPKFFKFKYQKPVLPGGPLDRERSAAEQQVNAALDEIIEATIFFLKNPEEEIPLGLHRVVEDLRNEGVEPDNIFAIERHVCDKYAPSSLDFRARDIRSEVFRAKIGSPDLMDFLDKRKGITPYSVLKKQDKQANKAIIALLSVFTALWIGSLFF